MTNLKSKSSFSQKRIRNKKIKSIFSKTFRFLLKELELHQCLFYENTQEVFEYNERAYLSMFCNAYLKSQKKQDEILIIQEYCVKKKKNGHGRVDALICDTHNSIGFLIEAKLWANNNPKKEPKKKQYTDWNKDFNSVFKQLNKYYDKDLEKSGLKRIFRIALIFGTIRDMEKYQHAYPGYEIKGKDPTDFYFLISDNKRGLEVYGKLGKEIEKS